MRRHLPLALVSVSLVIALPPVGAVAETPPCHAGGPPHVAWYARPSDTKHYIGYYVGGGCHCLGDPPSLTEGTWGWDYRGFLIPKDVVLSWCHGRRCQGGAGAYRTVGPTNLPSRSTP